MLSQVCFSSVQDSAVLAWEAVNSLQFKVLIWAAAWVIWIVHKLLKMRLAEATQLAAALIACLIMAIITAATASSVSSAVTATLRGCTAPETQIALGKNPEAHALAQRTSEEVRSPIPRACRGYRSWPLSNAKRFRCR